MTAPLPNIIGLDATGGLSGLNTNDKSSIKNAINENTASVVNNTKLLPIDVTQYGAIGDNSTDCLSAFYQASQQIYSISDISSRISNPNFTGSYSSGLADNWTYYKDTSITGTNTKSVDGYQQCSITTSTGQGGIGLYTNVTVNPGEKMILNLTYKSTLSSGNFSPYFVVYANSTGLIGANLNNSSNYTKYTSIPFIIPSGVTSINIYLQGRASSAGDTGTVTFKNIGLELYGGNKKAIIFPQNDTSNAIYYFSQTPDMSNMTIQANNEVKLSFPTTNSISFKHVNFASNIDIISRDRNNTGTQLENIYSNLIFNAMTENDIKTGVKTLSAITDASVSKNIYNTAGTKNTATLSIDSNNMYYMANTTDIPNSLTSIVTTEFNFVQNQMYYCDFEFNTPETSSSASLGVTTSLDGSHWSIFSININGTFGNGIFNGSWSTPNPWTQGKSSQFSGNDAYNLKTGVIFAVRPIGNNSIEIYYNGVYITTITIPFTFTKIGFGMICVNSTNQGLQNTRWGRLVDGECSKSLFGNSLNIVSFGDSITFGEGSISWAEFLPKLLQGQKGINKVSVTNLAVSGAKASDQLPIMQNVNLSNYDIVLILIGANDIQAQTDKTSFTTTVQNMIGLVESLGGTNTKVILGIPPMFISQALTGVGFNDGNFEKGAAYRSILMYLVATNSNVYLADTFSEFGRIGADNVLSILRDNLHPNEFGQVVLARCFARSILTALTLDA